MENRDAWNACDANGAEYAGYYLEQGFGYLGCLKGLGCANDQYEIIRGKYTLEAYIKWKLDYEFKMHCPSTIAWAEQALSEDGSYLDPEQIVGGIDIEDNLYWSQDAMLPPPEVIFCDAMYMACIMDHSPCADSCDSCSARTLARPGQVPATASPTTAPTFSPTFSPTVAPTDPRPARPWRPRPPRLSASTTPTSKTWKATSARIGSATRALPTTRSSSKTAP